MSDLKDLQAITPENLRLWADNPAAPGFVPIQPDTLRTLAARLEHADRLVAERGEAARLIKRWIETDAAWFGGTAIKGDWISAYEALKSFVAKYNLQAGAESAGD